VDAASDRREVLGMRAAWLRLKEEHSQRFAGLLAAMPASAAALSPRSNRGTSSVSGGGQLSSGLATTAGTGPVLEDVNGIPVAFNVSNEEQTRLLSVTRFLAGIQPLLHRMDDSQLPGAVRTTLIAMHDTIRYLRQSRLLSSLLGLENHN
jgi:PAS domain-containing protein